MNRYRQTKIEDAEYPHLKKDTAGTWCLFDDADKRIAELEKELATVKAERDAKFHENEKLHMELYETRKERDAAIARAEAAEAREKACAAGPWQPISQAPANSDFVLCANGDGFGVDYPENYWEQFAELRPPAIGNVERYGTDTRIPEPIPSVVSFSAPQPRDVEQEAREFWDREYWAYRDRLEMIDAMKNADAALAEWRERWAK